MKTINIFFLLVLLMNVYAKEVKKEIKIKQQIVENKKLILTLESENKYNLNDRYESVKEYKEYKKKKESNFNVDAGIDKKTKSVNKVKADIGIKF